VMMRALAKRVAESAMERAIDKSRADKIEDMETSKTIRDRSYRHNNLSHPDIVIRHTAFDPPDR
jgi:hypothetical protein